MKNLKKVLAVMTAVTAMAASTSAFAADANTATVGGDITGTYVDTDTTGTAPAYKLDITAITPAVVDDVAVTIDNAKDKTLLVLTEGADVDDETTASVDESAIDDGEILYIDQGTDAFTGLGLKDEIINTVTTEGKGHIIKVGYYDTNGNFYIANGTIAVTAPVVEPEEPEGTKVTFTWGDVNNDGAANGTDAGAIVGKLVGNPAKVGTSEYSIGETLMTGIVWGDVNCDGAANGTDAGAIVGKLVGNPAKVGTSEYSIGETVTITIPASPAN